MSENASARLGDYVAIPRAMAPIRFERDRRQAASDGGMTPEEVFVPLIAA